MAAARNASRVVGIYIDIVQPGYHNAIAVSNQGTLQEDLVLNTINSTGGTHILSQDPATDLQLLLRRKDLKIRACCIDFDYM